MTTTPATRTSSLRGGTEAGCLAHTRRKFFELHAQHQSPVAEQALDYIRKLYEIEREGAELALKVRLRLRQEKARPIVDAFHAWLIIQRGRVPNGSAIAKAIDYSLKRRVALTRYLEDGEVPVDNNWLENRIHPVAVGRSYVQLKIMLSSWLIWLRVLCRSVWSHRAVWAWG